MNETGVPVETIVFGARDWALIAGTLALVGGGLAVWSYALRNQLSGLRFVTMLLKATAVAALAFCLLEPMRRIERPRPGANVMAIVVDNSRSMEMRPPGTSQSRADRFRTQLPQDVSWQARLAQDFDVRRYVFDERLRAAEDFDDIEFDGNHSSLAGAVSTVQERFAQRPVAGLLLFSDGLATDDLESLVELQNEDAAFPIYPVAYGDQQQTCDIALGNVSVTMSAFELAPASVEALVSAKGLAGESITVRLMNANGETLERQTIPCENDDFEQKVRFQFQPPDPGFQIVKLRAMLSGEDSDRPDAQSRREVTVANNSRLVALERGGGPFQVLYVSGRPNWEFKFLRRALEEDIELDVNALIRIAKQEPKFSFRDRGVANTSNPLLEGFGDDEEAAEQYDEPVLLPIGPKSEDLKTGFPSTEESLYQFHAVILDDVEAEFFSQQQMLLLRQFVAERGGGLLMLGGTESFLGGDYDETPLGDILPVYLRGREDAAAKNQPVRYDLTREGSLEAWLRLRANEVDERARLGDMPEFKTWNSVFDIKPGSSVLATIETASGTRPGVVTQRFGKGRTMALTIGDLWRWGMRREEAENDDLAQTWRQITRWLTSDVPQRVAVEITPPESATDPHQLTITVRDPEFKPLDNASLEISVTEPDGNSVTLSASQDLSRPGVYVADYWSKQDGGYACTVDSQGPDGEVLPQIATGWTAEPSSREFARVEPDDRALQELAKVTGGEVIDIDQLDEFVETLPTKKVPITESRVEPLWHQPWLIFLAIGCLCSEWGLRRWKGLP